MKCCACGYVCNDPKCETPTQRERDVIARADKLRDNTTLFGISGKCLYDCEHDACAFVRAVDLMRAERKPQRYMVGYMGTAIIDRERSTETMPYIVARHMSKEQAAISCRILNQECAEWEL